MLTVAEVLLHPLFAGAKVVGGPGGLQHQVTWVHNVAVPDAPQWLDGGELALTTIFNMPQSEADQRDYIAQMAQKGVAALVITTGETIQAIPAHLCEAADACDLPLIDLSYKVKFVEIAKSVNQHIIQENHELVQRTLAINKRLTQTVLAGGGFQDLARNLADLLAHSISIETAKFEAIATLNIAPFDEARRYTQLHGRTDPRLVKALETRGILPKIRQTLHPVHIPAMPDVGLEMERILAPVVVYGEIYGFIWVIADDHEISKIDMMAIEVGATVAALLILYQESVQSAEASLKGSLLTQLIQGNSARETILTDQSLRYGVDLRLPFVMLVVECDGLSVRQIYRNVNQLVGAATVVGQFAGQVVLLAQAETPYNALAQRITQQVEAALRVGISAEHRGAAQVKRAHEECLDVLYIQARIAPPTHVVHFARLGYLYALYRAGRASLDDNAYVPLLRQLRDETQADLLNTLEAYLDAGGSSTTTAETLHIHRSTLNYRLTRITQLCAVDLQDPTERTNLQIALKLMRLFEHGTS